MPTEVYKIRYVKTLDGKEIEIIPLKIKFLREFMDTFTLIDLSRSEEQTIDILSECVRIAMKQYYPAFSKSRDLIQDNFDLPVIYRILNYAAGIKLGAEAELEEEITQEDQNNGEITTWYDLDLVKLESEIFVLGIWKNFDELEKNISLEELMQILSTIRDLSYEEKKFSAALQGIDLEGEDSQERGQKEWEDLKARVASGGQATDSNDILSLQGANAAKVGFGIGMGLGYEDMRDPSVMV